ncbi:Pex19 protein [Gracilaria domingensis]|nr:Pex19 protein [Gracilaria domingensis]
MDDTELDGILDGALEAFDNVQDGSSAPSRATEQSDVEEIARDVAPDQAIPEESGTRSPVRDDETGKALEEALKALRELGVGEDQGREEVHEEDMKLVEEFMTSLSSSLGNLAPQNAFDDQPRGAAHASEAEHVNGGRPEVEKLVDTIVGQLLSEDVLKLPMMHMRTAYEEWLPNNLESLSAEERERYTKQQDLVRQICAKYEAKADSAEIMELLSKMQDTGSPPDAVLQNLDSAAPGSPSFQASDIEKFGDMCPMQ